MTSTLQPAATTEAVRRPGRWLALSVLVLAVLLVAVDATVLGLATPYISEDLEPSGAQLLWIGDVYSFVIAGLLVSMGSLGDRIGRKRILLIGATAFGLISVLNAYATSPETMIAASRPKGGAAAASRNAAFTEATSVARSTCTVRSTTETTGTGTRREKPVRRPSSSGNTLPIALAAPVECGMIDMAAARPARSSLLG
jgi:hypothetical protein